MPCLECLNALFRCHKCLVFYGFCLSISLQLRNFALLQYLSKENKPNHYLYIYEGF